MTSFQVEKANVEQLLFWPDAMQSRVTSGKIEKFYLKFLFHRAGFCTGISHVSVPLLADMVAPCFHC